MQQVAKVSEMNTDNELEPVTVVGLTRMLEFVRREHAGLAERYERLEALINHVPDFIFVKDLEGRFLYANKAIVENNGFSSVNQIIGLTEADIHTKEAADGIAAFERHVIETGLPNLGIEERRIKGEGWLMMSAVPLKDRAGEIVGVVGASRDITARKRSEILMQAQASILQDVARGTKLKKFFRKALSTLDELFPGRAIALELVGEKTPRTSRRCHEIPLPSRMRDVVHGILAVEAVDGDDLSFLEFLSGVGQTIGIAIDRHEDAKRISYLAEHDPLTGLLNRTALDKKLGAILKAAALEREAVAVAFVDLDHFKLVNDSLGHGAGDELLKIIGKRIADEVGKDGLVARIGGDEFIVVLTGKDQPMNERLRAIKGTVSVPLMLSGMDLHVTCSVGVACFAKHGDTAPELFANADMALYRVKERGRDGIQIFTPSMADDARQKLRCIEQLRRAIENDEFVVHYQPQRNVSSGAVAGVEALVRWNHPKKGLVFPGDFIPLAEETGLIQAIGDSVLRKACHQAKAWQEAGFGPLTVAVNMSARQFRDANAVSKVADALAAAELDPSWLEIEITESMIMQDVEGAIAKMNGLTELGVSLSIDDFGTGYSSLSTLKKFPLTRLKIDRSFIQDIVQDSEDKAIVSAIVSLAKSLDLEVVAEGVETEEQAAFLSQAGCDTFQGYLFARPASAEAVESLLRQ